MKQYKATKIKSKDWEVALTCKSGFLNSISIASANLNQTLLFKELITSDHFGRSSRTGSCLSRPAPSFIREHHVQCNFCTSIENVKVSSFNDNVLLKLVESI